MAEPRRGLHRPADRPTAPPERARAEGERLSKRVAQLLGCSRSQAEHCIAGGWVRVDGRVVEEPMARISHQQVSVDADASLTPLPEVTLLLHKPAGFDTLAAPQPGQRQVRAAKALLQADTHMADDPAGTQVHRQHLSRLSPGVALETGASGLVVFTQDSRVLRKLTEDAALIEHEYAVEVQGTIEAAALARLNALRLQERLPFYKASINSTAAERTRLRLAVKGTHPGLIAYLCDQVGLHILSIKRLRIGRVALAQLPEGQWRFLGAHERF